MSAEDERVPGLNKACGRNLDPDILKKQVPLPSFARESNFSGPTTLSTVLNYTPGPSRKVEHPNYKHGERLAPPPWSQLSIYPHAIISGYARHYIYNYALRGPLQ